MNIRVIFGCAAYGVSVFLCALQMLFFPITDRPNGLSLLVLCFMTVFALLLGCLAFELRGTGALIVAGTSLMVSLGGLVWGALATLIGSTHMSGFEYAILSLYVLLYAAFGLAFSLVVKLPGTKVRWNAEGGMPKSE